MKSFEIITLGCKVNTYESEAMAELLEKSGRYFQCVSGENCEEDGCDADNRNTASKEVKPKLDIVILNSCMVTEESEKKAAKIIRRKKRENPGAIVVVTGCMSQIVPEKTENLGADIVLGNTKRTEIVEVLDEYFEKNQPLTRVLPHEKGEKFEILSVTTYKSLTRANLKIEDGCDCYCSYCIIPYARGHVRSMPPEQIYENAKAFVLAGHREIVLTGINIGMYGKDIGKNLLDAVLATKKAGAERIRLGSLEIDLLDTEIIKGLAKVEGFCPHFHTSLQSGSDTVLKRMNRHYTAQKYGEIVELIRENFENPSITTDIIVGFAGETEAEFEETCEFAKKIGFYKIHVFPYSRRSGTVGATLPGQVSQYDKKRRASKLSEIAKKSGEDFINSQIGTVQNVLFETKTEAFWYGHTENYMYVKVKSDEMLKNDIRKVKIAGIDSDNCIVGELFSQE